MDVGIGRYRRVQGYGNGHRHGMACHGRRVGMGIGMGMDVKIKVEGREWEWDM